MEWGWGAAVLEHIVSKFTEEPWNADHFTFQDIGNEGEFWDWVTSPGFGRNILRWA